MATYQDAIAILERYLDKRGKGRKYNLLGKSAERAQITQLREILQQHAQLSIRLERSRDTHYQTSLAKKSSSTVDLSAALATEISAAAWEEIKTVAQQAAGVTGTAPLKGAKFSTTKASPLTAEILVDFFNLSQSTKATDAADAIEWFGETHASTITTTASPRSSVSSASVLDLSDSDSEDDLDVGTTRAQQNLFEHMKSHTIKEFLEDTYDDLLHYSDEVLTRTLEVQIALSFATQTTTETLKEEFLVNTLFTSPVGESGQPYITLDGNYIDDGIKNLSAYFQVKPNNQDPTTALLKDLRIDSSGNFLVNRGADNIRLSTLSKDDCPTAHLTTTAAHKSTGEAAAGAGEPEVYIDKSHLKMCIGLLKIQDPALLRALDEKWFETPDGTPNYTNPYDNLYALAKLPLQLLQSKNATWLNKLDPNQLTPYALSLLHRLADRGAALTGLRAEWLTEDGLEAVSKLDNFILSKSYILQGLNKANLHTIYACANNINAIILHTPTLFETVPSHQFFELYEILDQQGAESLKSCIPLYQALQSIDKSNITYNLIQQLKYLFETANIFDREALRVPCNQVTLKIAIDAFLDEIVPDDATIDSHQDHQLSGAHLKKALRDNIEASMRFSDLSVPATKIKHAVPDQTWIKSHRHERELAELEAECRDATHQALQQARGRSRSPKSYLTRNGRRARQITGTPHTP